MGAHKSYKCEKNWTLVADKGNVLMVMNQQIEDKSSDTVNISSQEALLVLNQ